MQACVRMQWFFLSDLCDFEGKPTKGGLLLKRLIMRWRIIMRPDARSIPWNHMLKLNILKPGIPIMCKEIFDTKVRPHFSNLVILKNSPPQKKKLSFVDPFCFWDTWMENINININIKNLVLNKKLSKHQKWCNTTVVVFVLRCVIVYRWCVVQWRYSRDRSVMPSTHVYGIWDIIIYFIIIIII